MLGPNVFNRWIGAGVTLSRLFAHWPRTDLAQVHSDAATPDTDICARYFRLNTGSRLNAPFLVRRIDQQIRYMAGTSETFPPFFGRLTDRLMRWADEFAPQVIFSQLGSLPMTHITHQLVARYRVPLVIHISDDWMADWPANALGRELFPLTNIANRNMQRWFARSVREAAICLGIGDAMCEEFQGRFGKTFTPFYNCVDLAEWRDVPRVTAAQKRILYSGSVFAYGQYDSLVDIADAVQALSREGMNVRMDIHTQHVGSASHARALDRPPIVNLRPLVPHDMVSANLRAADLLLLPINFDETTRRFIRLSIPGKLAEYTASETPILAYGPESVAQVAFVRRERIAEVVSRRDPVALRSAIRAVLTDELKARALSSASRRVAASHFDLAKQQRRFEDLMTAQLGGLVAHG